MADKQRLSVSYSARFKLMVRFIVETHVSQGPCHTPSSFSYISNLNTGLRGCFGRGPRFDAAVLGMARHPSCFPQRGYGAI
jgi:hypothetical protein